MKYLLSVIGSLIFFYGYTQKLKEEFKVFDSIQNFKDIKLGTELIKAKSKMGLIHEKIAAPKQYTITNKKYLHVWNWDASDGFVIFLKSKMLGISIIIENSSTLKFSSI